MEILERRENNLLNRVELTFQWDHPNDPTPSLAEMIEAAAKSEPGSNKDFVFVKNVYLIETLWIQKFFRQRELARSRRAREVFST